ncbi:MAG: type III pantothenate kinase [Candidatus Omnitrophota bacterium]|jgi:type III pantothenate kinase
MLLAIDIGNTNISAGIFKGSKLLYKTKVPTYSYSSYIKRFKALIKGSGLEAGDVDEAIISSVVPLALARLVVELRRFSGTMKITIVGRDFKVPIRNMYRIKSEVGQDRLVNAFAAKTLYGMPCVIIDFGTAITFDIVSKRGDYLGGLILPGIELSLSSLYRNTALLPKVKLERSSSIIGKDTVNSMRGGILFGFGAMCDGLIAQYKKMLGKSTKVIATGGNSKLMKRYAKSIRHVDEDITLKGLSLIYY